MDPVSAGRSGLSRPGGILGLHASVNRCSFSSIVKDWKAARETRGLPSGP